MSFYSNLFARLSSSGEKSGPSTASSTDTMVSEEVEVEEVLFGSDSQVYDEPESMVPSSEASLAPSPLIQTPVMSNIALPEQEPQNPTRRKSWWNIAPKKSAPAELANALGKYRDHDIWIIPGIGGSHLEACQCESFRTTSICEDGCQQPRTLVWPSFRNGNMAAKPCLAPQVLHSFWVLDFWKPLRQTATTCGTELFEYAYDFTRPISVMGAKFAERLLAHHRERQRPLIIVAHSLGGLVTLEALAAVPELLPLVAGIVCLGSPFGGSADAFVRRKSGFKGIVSAQTIATWQSLDALEPCRGNAAWRDSVTSRTQSCGQSLPPVVAVSCRERKTKTCESFLEGGEPVLVITPNSGDGTVTFESATTLPSPWPKPQVVTTTHGHVDMINFPGVFIDALSKLASLCQLS